MSRRETTLEIDEDLFSALRRAAAEDGVAPSELLDGALRRYFGLRGIAVLDELAERGSGRDDSLTDDEAMTLAVEEVRAARAERRAASS